VTVREWFRGMRYSTDALMFAADVERTLTERGPISHIRSYDVTLIFDLAAFQSWQHKQFFIQRLTE